MQVVVGVRAGGWIVVGVGVGALGVGLAVLSGSAVSASCDRHWRSGLRGSSSWRAARVIYCDLDTCSYLGDR